MTKKAQTDEPISQPQRPRTEPSNEAMLGGTYDDEGQRTGGPDEIAILAKERARVERVQRGEPEPGSGEVDRLAEKHARHLRGEE